MQKMYFWDSLSVKDASHFLFFRNGPVHNSKNLSKVDTLLIVESSF